MSPDLSPGLTAVWSLESIITAAKKAYRVVVYKPGRTAQAAIAAHITEVQADALPTFSLVPADKLCSASTDRFGDIVVLSVLKTAV